MNQLWLDILGKGNAVDLGYRPYEQVSHNAVTDIAMRASAPS